ncbi:hypothetical protein ACFQ48_15450 [Hymenobacter caeli]|uniref:Opacity protein-like surface antigen n=1 Tax=Hymenobacter caeli TaxID=2735894 RepID=A0ABX2FSM3_9BACT|nr:hypothetical protein [Hymenobacter caeli]NRT19464.1 opacity protein-like surface antigen [Hymenobacter caeli]
MKKLILLSVCLLALATRPAAAQTTTPDIVVVRIAGDGNSTQLVVTRGEGKSEKIEFPSGRTDKQLMAASEGYYKVLSALYREGYVLKSTFTTGTFYTTLVLDKIR